MKIVHSNLLIISENLCIWKNHLSLRMCLNHTLHPLMNNDLSCKVFFLQDRRIIQINFHQLVMSYYLHQRISPWQINIICIQWNIRIYVITIIDVSYPVVWCLMTSSCIHQRTINCHTLLKIMIFFLQRSKTTSFICTEGHFKIFTEKKELTSL